MKRPIIYKFLQPEPKIENKGFSSLTWSKNFRRLHRRHKIMRSAGANDVQTESTNLNGYESGDDDIELQQIIFYSAQFHSGKNSKSSSNHSVGKTPVEIEYFVIPNSLNLIKSTTTKGESSRTFCVICENDIHEMIAMKCIASDCKGILDLDSIMPVDFLMRVRDAIRLTEVLASSIFIDFPFMDCMGTLVDDLREYPIKACSECWRIFYFNCKSLHLG
ncbi:hypothetical protein R3W88_001189 [Solanum pinnatisectum]|uniref:Uncharacterized protein n=1 Tax=Solanum pinnatisectum TaxID=50273 RepID=A0AAV9MJK2_9SOLN|nr:hypothetical protein R3W88_001189 [Solanum pinnatisectum]